MVKNRVHALLDKHEVSVGFTDLFGARGGSWLRGLKLPGNDGLILKLALDEIDRLDGLIDEVSRVIAGEAVEDPWVELLLGFKGIDYYTAMVVLYEVGDINRFCSARKPVRLGWLVHQCSQSGEHCRRGGISKQGNKWVRWALVQAAHQAARQDPKLRRSLRGLLRARRLLLLLLGSWLSLFIMF
jgi:transposase